MTDRATSETPPSLEFAKAVGLTLDQLLDLLERFDLALIKPGTVPPWMALHSIRENTGARLYVMPVRRKGRP